MPEIPPEPFIDASPYFPVLDAPRTEANAELGRVIMDFPGYVEPKVRPLCRECVRELPSGDDGLCDFCRVAAP